MIDYEIFCKIKNLKEQHNLTPCQIADNLALDVRTVVKWLEEKQFHPRAQTGRGSKLDSFRDEIIRLIETHPYTAAQIFQRIREQGFSGSYTIVKRYVRKIRPRRSPAFLKLFFAPGECAQVDWGSYGSVNVGNTRRRLSFFAMVLCYSRMMYVEFTVSQTIEHFLACHQNAFDFFGGIPKKIMVDNLKSAVLRRIVGQAPIFNRKYLDFANHCGFTITPCAIGKGNEKGRVENGIKYIKKNFLGGLELHDFSAINPAVSQWMDSVANIRIHGETRQKPTDMFEKERPYLTALSPHPFDIATVSQIRASSQFRITIDTNRYSVPAEYAGTRLTLKTYPDRLCVYFENKMVARHPRSYDRNKDFENPDHPKELLAQRKKAKNQKILMRFLTLSSQSEEYYRKLEQHRMNPSHHVKKIVALSEIYNVESVDRAIRDAFLFQAFSCEYIANILEQRSRVVPEASPLHLTRSEDLLDIEVERPDLSIYGNNTKL